MTIDELIATREGLALANAAWKEGATAMLRAVNEHESGPWTKPVSPYSAPLLEMIATNRENYADEDDFAPGECDGSGTCSAPIHVHGCYRPHRSDECDSPDEYGHTDRENGSTEG